MVALARACGPTYGGSLFAWSDTNGLAWPVDFHFTFYMCAMLTVGVTFLSTMLPESVNLKLKEDEGGKELPGKLTGHASQQVQGLPRLADQQRKRREEDV